MANTECQLIDNIKKNATYTETERFLEKTWNTAIKSNHNRVFLGSHFPEFDFDKSLHSVRTREIKTQKTLYSGIFWVMCGIAVSIFHLSTNHRFYLRKFCLTGGMANRYPFRQGSLESLLSELFFQYVLLLNQYKFAA